MESVQALLAAQAADAVVGFLYRVHRQDRTPKGEHPPSYEANPEFNGSVDELHGMVRIFDLEFRPSEVLYEMEPESYRVYLTDFQADSDRVESNAVPDEATKTPL